MSDLLTPWTVGCYDPRYVFDRHGEEVAFFPSRYEVAVPQARLTAAAPELLAALKMARTELGNMSISEGSANWDDVWTAVNAAIAKVETQP